LYERKITPETIYGGLGRTVMLHKTIFGKMDVIESNNRTSASNSTWSNQMQSISIAENN